MNMTNNNVHLFNYISKKIIVFLAILVLIGNIFFWIESSDTICTNMSGYGVDTEGKVYVGKHLSIDVYKENNLVNTIKLKDGGEAYSFEINKENLIVVQTYDETYEMDLKGNSLRTIVSGTDDVNYKIDTTREFVSSEGVAFIVKNYNGREKVVRYENGKETIVFQLPLNAYIFGIVKNLHTLFFMISVFIIIYKTMVARYGKFPSSLGAWINIFKKRDEDLTIYSKLKKDSNRPTTRIFRVKPAITKGKMHNIELRIDKVTLDKRIKPYIINSIGLLVATIVIITGFNIASYYTMGSQHRYLIYIVAIPWFAILYVRYLHTEFLIAYDVSRNNIAQTNAKIIKIKHYRNAAWSREVFSMFYKNPMVSRYKLTIEDLSDNTEVKMHMYLTYDEAKEIVKSSKTENRFCITYLIMSKAIAKIESIE